MYYNDEHIKDVTEQDFTRYAKDTYPEKFYIKTYGSLVNLDGWDVYLRYVEDEDNEGLNVKIVSIKGQTNEFKPGEVKFYPRSDYTKDITVGEPGIKHQGLEITGDHRYYIYREKEFYYIDESGSYVTLDEGETYIPYDSGNAEHSDLTRYEPHVERMTHYTGSINIKSGFKK